MRGDSRMMINLKSTFRTIGYLFCIISMGSFQTFAQSSSTVTATVRDLSGTLLSNISIQFTIGEESETKATGPDGVAVFSTVRTGSYAINAESPGYTIASATGNLSAGSTALHEMTGTEIPMTLSGTVKTASGAPVSSPILLFNGSQTVTIDAEYGTFSIPVTFGTHYELTIDDAEWLFTNPRTQGFIHGDTRLQYIAIPK